MSLLSMESLNKAYGLKQLLQSVSFTIEEGDKIGLLGKNGSGKSTFLKLAAGLEAPDDGQITFSKSLRIEYLSQNPQYDGASSVLETVLQGDSPNIRLWQHYHDTMKAALKDPEDSRLQQALAELNHEMDRQGAWGIESEAQSILTRLGVTSFDTLIGSLSGGQRKRVALAAALMNPADLLILDEPTNHLDNTAIDWLEKYLLKFSGTLLMVTHDRYFLERVTNRIIELDRGRLFSYPGNYSQYLERKLAREEIEAASTDKKRSMLRKELAWMLQGAKARTTKQKARIQRFEKLQQENLKTGGGGALQISSAASRLGKKTIILDQVYHSYGAEPIIDSYSCILDRDERMGIVGPNGIGKSTLLGIMQGSIEPVHGSVEIGTTVKIGYFPQESTGLPEEMRVIDYIREGGEYLAAGKKSLSASQMLETFLFPASAQWNILQKLSGGELRRLHLLRILMEAPNVLLLDEPGNDLDIETLTILEDYLDDFPGAVVAVSHDRFFLDRVCERILAFSGQGRLQEYPGNYTDYLARSSALPENQSGGSAESAPVVRRSASGSAAVKAPKLTYMEQKEFDEIEGTIEIAEIELAAVNDSINQAGSDYQLLEQLEAERIQLEARLDELLERWTYLTERTEEISRHKNGSRL